MNSKQISFLSSSNYLAVFSLAICIAVYPYKRGSINFGVHKWEQKQKQTITHQDLNLTTNMLLTVLRWLLSQCVMVRHQSSSCFSAKMCRLNETIYHNIEDFFYHFLLPIKHFSIDFHTHNIDRCRKPELIRQITLLKTGSKVIMTKVTFCGKTLLVQIL